MFAKGQRTRVGFDFRTLLVLPVLLLLPFGPLMMVHAGSRPTDPGVRGGPPGGGGPMQGLTADQMAFFTQGQSVFNETVSVQGTDPDTRVGLGPGFNSNSCESCHSQPASGGTSPLTTVPQPQIAIANLDGAVNTIPSFIFQGGPVREARFVSLPNGAPDGGVHNVFTITGRSDAPGCNTPQPDFAAELAAHNVGLRIPLQLFGDGLVEMIRDQDILNQQAYECSNPLRRQGISGICGTTNPSGNTGTLLRFGWKDQNPTLMLFAFEASDVELGVTNETFPNERIETPGCQFNTLPEDQTNFTQSGSGVEVPSDAAMIDSFMRMLAQPVPGQCPGNPSTCTTGGQLFQSVGCALCHKASYQTPTNTSVTAMSNVTVNLLSDLLTHHMGPGLADCITQGAATGDMFRTQPLWNVGQRVFFLHDGRTTDIYQAIEDHMGNAGTAACGTFYGASEANPVITKFNGLSEQEQQDILNYLRSL